MNLRVSFDRGWWIQSAIGYLLSASLGTSCLCNLVVIVLETEEVWHVVCGYLLLASTAHGILMNHGLALIEISTHVHTLNIDWLWHTVRLVVKVRVISHVIARLYIDLKKFLSFRRWRTDCRLLCTCRCLRGHLTFKFASHVNLLLNGLWNGSHAILCLHL